MFSRVVAVVGVATLLYATYAVHVSQAQTPSGQQAAGEAEKATSPQLVFKYMGTGGGKPYNVSLSRSKVPGGWLIIAISDLQGGGHGPGSNTAAGGLTFYPDPDHKWDGSSLP